MLLGLLFLALGVALIVISVAGAFEKYALSFGSSLAAALGVFLLALGVIILLTEALVGMLSRSQTTLVDGLQAG